MEEQKVGSLDLKINMKSHGNDFFFKWTFFGMKIRKHEK